MRRKSFVFFALQISEGQREVKEQTGYFILRTEVKRQTYGAMGFWCFAGILIGVDINLTTLQRGTKGSETNTFMSGSKIKSLLIVFLLFLLLRPRGVHKSQTLTEVIRTRGLRQDLASKESFLFPSNK